MTTRAYVPMLTVKGLSGLRQEVGAMYVASPIPRLVNRVASTAWVQSIVADALADALAKQKALTEAITRLLQRQTQAKLDATRRQLLLEQRQHRPAFWRTGKPFLLVIRSLPRAPEVTLSALLRTAGKNTANGNINSPDELPKIPGAFRI